MSSIGIPPLKSVRSETDGFRERYVRTFRITIAGSHTQDHLRRFILLNHCTTLAYSFCGIMHFNFPVFRWCSTARCHQLQWFITHRETINLTNFQVKVDASIMYSQNSDSSERHTVPLRPCSIHSIEDYLQSEWWHYCPDLNECLHLRSSSE